MNIFSSINSFCIQRITTGAPAALKIYKLWEPNDGYFSSFVLRKKRRHLGASWWWCHQRDKRRDYTNEARFEENKVIKKGNFWGNFFSDIHLYKYQESTECNMNFKDLTFVKLSADCATKGTKDAVILMRSPGGKQGDKERRRKHSRDYKCSSRCNAQFTFILLFTY